MKRILLLILLISSVLMLEGCLGSSSDENIIKEDDILAKKVRETDNCIPVERFDFSKVPHLYKASKT